MNPEDERALIDRAKQQPEAFRDLYRHYFPRLYGYVAARVGHVPDAEDLVSIVFIKVVEALHRFEYRGEGAFAAWVFSIAHNEVSQFYRKQNYTALPLEDMADSHDAPPDELVIRKEQFARLYGLIGTLSARRQEIVTLKFFGELRNQEIAAVLGLDERTVASHLCRALDDLQQKYLQETEKER
ncbi:MAG: sigma-70 family RNA polymerase sigma factor [Anaerolineae bacterium]